METIANPTMSDHPVWSPEQLRRGGDALRQHPGDRAAVLETFGVAPEHADDFERQALAESRRASNGGQTSMPQ